VRPPCGKGTIAGKPCRGKYQQEGASMKHDSLLISKRFRPQVPGILPSNFPMQSKYPFLVTEEVC